MTDTASRDNRQEQMEAGAHRIAHQEDAALTQESKNLSNAAEIARIAREQYQLVSPGQQAYEVLPPTGSSATRTPYSGDPALSAPVDPSAASVLPPGSETATTQPPHTASVALSHVAATGLHPAPPRGILGRMLGALEFWR